MSIKVNLNFIPKLINNECNLNDVGDVNDNVQTETNINKFYDWYKKHIPIGLEYRFHKLTIIPFTSKIKIHQNSNLKNYNLKKLNIKKVFNLEYYIDVDDINK